MMDLALRAIAEPRRRDILLLVLDAESSSGEIASHFDVTGPAISQHLKVLGDGRSGHGPAARDEAYVPGSSGGVGGAETIS